MAREKRVELLASHVDRASYCDCVVRRNQSEPNATTALDLMRVSRAHMAAFAAAELYRLAVEGEPPDLECVQYGRFPFTVRPTFFFSHAHNARVDTSHLARSSYASGYFLAAQLLAIHAREDRLDNNLLALPICYLLRHNLELNLKELIAVGRQIVGTTVPQIKHHRLNELWTVSKDLLRRTTPDKPDPEAFLRVDRISAVDEDAQAFRFPKKVSGA